MLKESIHRHRFDYIRGALIITIKDEHNSNLSMKPYLFNIQDGRKVFNLDLNVALVDGRHHSCAILELSVMYKAFERKNLGPQVTFLTIGNGQVKLLPTILYSGRCCNNLAGPILSYVHFLDTLKTILRFARTFEIEIGISFLKVEVESSLKISRLPTLAKVQVEHLVFGIFALASSSCGAPMPLVTVNRKCLMFLGSLKSKPVCF